MATMLRFSPSILSLSLPSPPSSSAHLLSRKPHLSIIRNSGDINPPTPTSISKTLNLKASLPISISETQTLKASSPDPQILRKPSPIISDTLISVAKTLLTRSITLIKLVSQILVLSFQNQQRQMMNTDQSLSSSAAVTAITAVSEAEKVKNLRSELIMAGMAPSALLCFASISTNSVNTPLTVVASGMAKWLELYSGVLMLRVLLSWFPNIPWERQPLQAIRDMCDPYLNLFRNIVPPLFNALDVSPLLAFLVLGLLASILNTTIQT